MSCPEVLNLETQIVIRIINSDSVMEPNKNSGSQAQVSLPHGNTLCWENDGSMATRGEDKSSCTIISFLGLCPVWVCPWLILISIISWWCTLTMSIITFSELHESLSQTIKTEWSWGAPMLVIAVEVKMVLCEQCLLKLDSWLNSSLSVNILKEKK